MKEFGPTIRQAASAVCSTNSRTHQDLFPYEEARLRARQLALVGKHRQLRIA